MLNTSLSPWPCFTQEEADAVSKVLLSNKVNYWTGSECRKFEKEFAAFAGTRYAVALSNGTLALDVALKAIGIGAGNDVIVTSRTFLASASCIVNAGANPVFADVDLNSQNISAETIKAALTSNTKAIIVVHLAGMPAEMDGIMDLAKEHDLWVIEDCAQAHGAKYKGKSVGSIGHVGAWSFCQDKIMTTGGEGGMVTTNDKTLWEKMWSYKDHGKSYDAVYHREHAPGFRWLHESFGTNWRMMEMQAAIGRIQLKRLPEWTACRQAHAAKLAESLGKFKSIRLKELRETCIQKRLDTEILPFLGSVQNRTLLEHVMTAFSVATVYHAAAYKHVPMVEFNTVEGIRNNIFGTLECALAATASGVRTFVLISTDKAVRPTNTMGAGKRMAELCLQALAAEPGQKTRFSMVRFGNVLGSSGSVVPLFEKQIAEGGPLTLTHPEITRYFMTIPEAAQLVIQAGAMGTGGDVFVLDMGESVKIIDLARQMITLSGLKPKTPEQPDGDIEILITGLRPGEKLYEELLIGDNVRKTGHPRIMTADEAMLPWHELSVLLDRIRAACDRYDQQAIRTLLINAPTGFTPSDGICDLLWVRETHRKNAV
ncbi:TPA: polysaccharide biosynthesis protein [Neisseria meningitidis]